MAQDIKGVEIFSTGKHRGSDTIDITDTDLDQMVASFETLASQDGFKPVLKLGHEDTQKYFGQRKGAPNLGFVERIWREGNKILADFGNVPDAIIDMIKQRRYNAVSIEMFPKAEIQGKTFANVLTAVALLGAELPAVKGLKELAAYLFEIDEISGQRIALEYSDDYDKSKSNASDKIQASEEDGMFKQEQVDALIETAVNKAKSEIKAEFEGKVADLEKQVETLTGERDTAKNALKEYADATRKGEFEAIVDAAIKDGKILPKQKDEVMALAESLSGQVKFGDGEKSATEIFKSLLDGMGKKVDLSEKGTSDPASKETSDDAMNEVDARARKLMSENTDIDYRQAFHTVLDQNEELKQRYFAMED